LQSVATAYSIGERNADPARDANGQAAFNILASLRAASIRAPGEAKLVISHDLRRLSAVSR
jgi:hypothetical protein